MDILIKAWSRCHKDHHKENKEEAFSLQFLTWVSYSYHFSCQLLNSRPIKFKHLNEIPIIQCMGRIFCVEFQSVALKFHTKYLTHTLKNMFLYSFNILKALRGQVHFSNIFQHYINLKFISRGWTYNPYLLNQLRTLEVSRRFYMVHHKDLHFNLSLGESHMPYRLNGGP